MHILEPIIHETIWGGTRLSGFCASSSKSIGHLYSVIDTPEMNNRIIGPGNHPRTLHDWFRENRDRYGLAGEDRVPILTALVDANQDLSIQVHPPVSAASRADKSGKNESFYFLEAPVKGAFYDGCKMNSLEALSSAIAEDRISETVAMSPVKKGDYVYIEGGTLHAATAGSLIFEIEENSGRTYRFYDYDRIDVAGKKRELHIQKALSAVAPWQKSFFRSYDGGWIREAVYSSRLMPYGEKVECPEDMFLFAIPLAGKIMVGGGGDCNTAWHSHSA